MLRPIFRTQIEIYRFEPAVTYLEFGELIITLWSTIGTLSHHFHMALSIMMPLFLTFQER